MILNRSLIPHLPITTEAVESIIAYKCSCMHAGSKLCVPHQASQSVSSSCLSTYEQADMVRFANCLRVSCPVDRQQLLRELLHWLSGAARALRKAAGQHEVRAAAAQQAQVAAAAARAEDVTVRCANGRWFGALDHECASCS